MKRLLLLIAVVLLCFSCSKRQVPTQEFAQEIEGCWEIIDLYYELETNYPSINSLVDKLPHEIKYPLVMNLTTGKGLLYLKGLAKPILDDSFNYRIQGDTLAVIDVVESDAKLFIDIQNDSLYIQFNMQHNLEYVLSSLTTHINWEKENMSGIPDDIKCKQAKGVVTLVRIHNCSFYEDQ